MQSSNPNYYRMLEHSSSIANSTQEAVIYQPLPKHSNITDKVTQKRRYALDCKVNTVEQGAYRTIV